MDNLELSTILLSLAATFIFFFLLYIVITAAVKRGIDLVEQQLRKQNRILLKLLNEHGVSKDEIIDIFVEEKVDFYPSLKQK